MRFNIKEKIISGFSLVVLMAMVMVAGAYASLMVIADVVNALTPIEARRDYITEVQQLVSNTENHLDQYLTVSGEEYRRRIAQDNGLLEAKLGQLQQFLVESKSQKTINLSIQSDGQSLLREITILLSLDLANEKSGRLNKQILTTYESLRKFSVSVDKLALISRQQVADQIVGARAIIAQTIVRVLYFIFFLSVVSLFISIFIARMLTRPTLALISTAKRFSRGDHTARAHITSHDEIGELASVFNEMASTLESYTHNLEAEVHERTKQLDEKVAKLNSANSELDNRASLLVKRDQQLTLANEKLHELDKIKTEFLSIAAHQLRTPLSAVKWIFSVLLEEHSSKLLPEQKAYLIKGEESNNRMIRLVDDMLTVTRIESGRTKFNFYTLALEDILKNTIADFTPRAREKEIELTYTQGAGVYPKILIDPEKIGFLLENLLENALRYTHKGGTISVSLDAVDGNLVIRVTDTGIGIPDDEQKNVFTKFFRATNAIKTITDGNGLGLFVAKNVVEHHGGQISFTSKMGEGTIFRVQIPIANTPVSDIPKETHLV